MTTNMFHMSKSQYRTFLIHNLYDDLYHRLRTTTGTTSGTGSAYSCISCFIRSSPRFQCVSCCSIFSFLCNGLWIVVSPFVLFILAIVLSVCRFHSSVYRFDIFRLFFFSKVKLKDPKVSKNDFVPSRRITPS